MIVDLTLLAGGILLLILGAEAIVRGGVAIAHRLRLSPLWIGLTVVAVGTSAPEIAVTFEAILAGQGDIALGNVVGSNILNLLLVLGAIAVVQPVAVKRVVRHQDLPWLAAMSLGVWLLATKGSLGWPDGVLLIAATMAFIAWIYRRERKRPEHVALIPAMAEQHPSVAIVVVLAGFVALGLGGSMVLEGALGIAERAGISERVIAVTVIAIGTSLPELAVGMAGAYRKQVAMVMGNLVGSNILNLGIVLGPALLADTITVSRDVLVLDSLVMVGAVVAVWALAWRTKRIGRIGGGVLLVGYGAYVAVLLL